MATHLERGKETAVQKRARLRQFAGKGVSIKLIHGAVGYKFGSTATNPSQTSGRTKGGVCQASSVKRYMANRSRSYKHRDYEVWYAKTLKICKVSSVFEEK